MCSVSQSVINYAWVVTYIERVRLSFNIAASAGKKEKKVYKVTSRSDMKTFVLFVKSEAVCPDVEVNVGAEFDEVPSTCYRDTVCS